jgi:hypothetical protein
MELNRCKPDRVAICFKKKPHLFIRMAGAFLYLQPYSSNPLLRAGIVRLGEG